MTKKVFFLVGLLLFLVGQLIFLRTYFKSVTAVPADKSVDGLGFDAVFYVDMINFPEDYKPC